MAHSAVIGLLCSDWSDGTVFYDWSNACSACWKQNTHYTW